MDTALGWVGRIAEFLISLVPHLDHIREFEVGILCVLNQKPRVVKGFFGIVIYWPPVMTFDKMDLRPIPTNLVAQTVGDKTYDTRIVWRINDPLLAFTTTTNYEDQVIDEVRSEIFEAILRCEGGPEEMAEFVYQRANNALLLTHGLFVVKIKFVEKVDRIRALKHYGITLEERAADS